MGAIPDSQISKLVVKYFGDTPDVRVLIAICLAESGGVVDSVGDNYPRWQTASSPARYDYGLMQINSQHGFNRDKLLSSADYNMQAARKIYDVQGLRAWTTFNTGAYKAYLPRAVSPDISGYQKAMVRLFMGGEVAPQPLDESDYYSYMIRVPK